MQTGNQRFVAEASTDYDIIIIGSGAAGSSAALSAAEAAKKYGRNLRIVVLERAKEEEWGGNSRWTTSNFRMVDENHLYDSFEKDLIEDTKGMINSSYVARLVSETVDTVRWVISNGVKLEVRDNDNRMTRRIGPVGGGLPLITVLRQQAEKLGVIYMLETTALNLSLDINGRVDGTWVMNRNGERQKLSAGAVILAAGGFEGNREMLAKYIGPDAANIRLDNPGTRLHMGECINMALAVGAKPSGEYGSYHGVVMDPRSTAYSPVIHVYPYGILVNSHGKRFIDEGMNTISESFEFISRAILHQHTAYLILDSKFLSIPNTQKILRTDKGAIEANTIEDLATKMGVPQGSLVETVRQFNEAVLPGNFEPTRPDGKRTSGAVDPPKSNWAMPIDKPPYLCYPVESAIQFTWGGIAVDDRGRVIATNDAPIPNLYAAGEIVGSFYHHYTGGTAVLSALTYGRIVGLESVRQLSESPNSSPKPLERHIST